MIVKKFTIEETGTEVELHPVVSVLTNVTSAERASILRALGYVFLGGDATNLTEVEIHGESMLLTPATIHQFGLAGVDVDPVVTSNDIAAALEAEVVRREALRFEPALLDVEDFLRSTPEGIYAELDECRREYSRFLEGRNEYAQHLQDLSIAYNDAERKHGAAVQALAAAKQMLRTPKADDASIQSAKFPLEQQIAEMRRQEELVHEKMKELDGGSTLRFAELLRLCEQEARGTTNAIADEIERLNKFIVTSERKLGEKGLSVERVLSDYVDKKEKKEAVERKLTAPSVSADKRERLEAVHHEIAAMEANPKRKPEHLRALMAEQEYLLGEMGFPTWTAYIMADQVAAADPLAVQELQVAEGEFKVAEEKWLRLSAEIQSLDGYLESMESLQEMLGATRLLLGVPEGQEVDVDNVVKALRSSFVSLGERTQLTVELEKALASFGLPVPSNNDVTAMVGVGQNFLANDPINNMMQRLEKDLLNIRQSIFTLQEQIKIIEERSVDNAQDVLGSIGKLSEDVVLSEKKKDALMEEFKAKQDLSRLYENGIKKVQLRINDIVLVLAENEYISNNLPDIDTEEKTDEDLLREYIFQRFAEVRNVGRAGSFPIVFDEPFAGLDNNLVVAALEEIGRFSEGAQTILITDSQIAGSWALQAGPMLAEIVSPSVTGGV